jgi:sec-independent protein translocase protein TatA
MKIGPFGVPELLIILVILLLVFGARRLPDIGTSLGRSIRTFKSAVTGEESGSAPDVPGTPGSPNGREDDRT